MIPAILIEFLVGCILVGVIVTLTTRNEKLKGEVDTLKNEATTRSRSTDSTVTALQGQLDSQNIILGKLQRKNLLLAEGLKKAAYAYHAAHVGVENGPCLCPAHQLASDALAEAAKVLP